MNDQEPAFPQGFPTKNDPAVGLKNRLLKNRWFFVIALVVVLGVLGWILSQKENGVYTYAEVYIGTLSQTVEVSGELEGFLEADLAFSTSGMVERVFVRAGDEVVEGQVLAILQSSDALADVMVAQEAVNLSQANLQKFLAGATAQEIAVSSAQVVSAQADFDSTVALAEIGVEEAVLNYEDAQNDLEHILAENTEDLLQIYDDLQTTLFGAVIDVRSALSAADEILGVENTLYNRDFKYMLSANDPQQYTWAKNAYSDAAQARERSEDAVYALLHDLEWDTNAVEALDSAITLTSEALAHTSETLMYTRRVLDATRSDSVDLTLVEATALKTTIDTKRDTIQVEQSGLSTQIQALNTALLSIQASEDAAYHTLAVMQQAHERALSNAQTSVAIAQASLNLYEAQHDGLVAQKRASDTAPYYAQIGQAQAQLAVAEARLKKTEIRAPFSGVVTHMEMGIGDYVSMGYSVTGIQSTQEQYRIVMDVPESDIVKIDLDDAAVVTFDAYGNNVKVPARVGAMNPGETNIEGVVYYRVEIYLDEDVDVPLNTGMSATVTVFTNTLEDVLYIQQRAVFQYEDGTSYVRLATEDGYREQVVVTGLRADGGFVQILSGLQAGDRVVSSMKN